MALSGGGLANYLDTSAAGVNAFYVDGQAGTGPL